MPPTKTPTRSPARPRASPSRARAPAKAATPKKSTPKAATSKAATSAAVAKREAELAAARGQLGLRTAPLRTLGLFTSATGRFLGTTAAAVAASKPAVCLVYPALLAYVGTRRLRPEWYSEPGCGGGPLAGPLFFPELLATEFVWWLVLGILSSIGFGTGLHSGLMFLWPFVMATVLKAEDCGSTSFSALYSHPCSLQCSSAAKNDGTLSFLNVLLVLLPAVIIWGCGTAIGELPPYFITRAARRAGKRASDFESELAEARKNTDVVSQLKVWTISFTERNGFLGIYLLASWPNAAFDMCGMACGWLEMPFWTFFGATMLGKGFTKVTLQTAVCIAAFGPSTWGLLLKMAPLGWRATMGAGRSKLMYKFALQERLTPAQLLGGARGLDAGALIDKLCAVQATCGPKGLGGYASSSKWTAASEAAGRALGAYDINGDGSLSLAELEAARGATDGKVSLASLDPGEGGYLSVGNLWNGFIVGLILFFVVSIVEQVALAEQAELDGAELDAMADGGNKPKTTKQA